MSYLHRLISVLVTRKSPGAQFRKLASIGAEADVRCQRLKCQLRSGSARTILSLWGVAATL